MKPKHSEAPRAKQPKRRRKLAAHAALVVPLPVNEGPATPLPDLNILKPKIPKKKPIPPVGPALALSGGAAHGDFEVGVVRYLYEHGLKPKIICGTSVGAINGLKLAEGEPDGPAQPDANGHVQGLAGLIGIWKSLKYNTDMWKMLDPVKKLIDVLKNAAIGVGAGTLVGGGILGPLGLFVGAAAGARLEEDSVINALEVFLSTNSLADFYPLQDLMERRSSFDSSMVKSSKIILRVVMTALEDGALRMVDEKGRLLESDGTQTPGPPRYNAAASQTLNKIKQLEEAINSLVNGMDDPGKDPGQATTINSLRNRVRDLRTSIASDIIGSKPIKVPLTLAALASSSLPVLTPSQEFMDSKNYVDGGTRMVTPIQVALDAGATVVYAVVASCDTLSAGVSPITHKPLSSYTSANIADIAIRVGGDIEPSAINDSQLYPLMGFPVPVLIFRPCWDLHDSLTVAPGLIDIRMDQGWMCADDVMQAWALDAANYGAIAERFDEERHTTWITHYRHRIWMEEYAANGLLYLTDKTGAPLDATGAPPVPVPFTELKKKKTAALALVRRMKQELRDLVQQRLDAHGNVPPWAERWWLDWERHTWTPTEVLWPLAKMTVKAQPNKGVRLDKPTTVKITAADASGKAISDATVYAGGVELGPTGAITTTFKSTEIHTVDSKKRPVVRDVGPKVVVAATGFETTRVPILFNTSTAQV